MDGTYGMFKWDEGIADYSNNGLFRGKSTSGVTQSGQTGKDSVNRNVQLDIDVC